MSQNTNLGSLQSGFGGPPEKYDQAYMQRFLKAVLQWMDHPSINTLTLGGLTAINFPTWGAHLRAGQVYVTSEGLLRVIQAEDVLIGGFQVTIKMGHAQVL